MDVQNLDFYGLQSLNSGYNYGRTLIQAHGSVGGNRAVFVGLEGVKNELVFVPFGGHVKNPFKGNAKMFAGDLCEYRTDGSVYFLKTYLVQDDVAAAATVVYIVRDGYKHIPFVGDILMKAPSTLTGTGTAATVTAVEKTTNGGANVWKLTLSAAVGAMSANDVMIEGVAAGTTTAVVTNPNTMLPMDCDFNYNPAANNDDFEGARYLVTPVLSALAWANKLSPMPSSVLALNKSRVTGWFSI